MITACLVTASALVSTAFLAVPLASGAISALRVLNLHTALFKCALLTGLLGCLLPLAQSQYNRAMELLQQGDWNQMQAHMNQNPEVKGTIRGFFNKLSFYVVLCSPKTIDLLPISPSTESLFVNFLPNVVKESRIKEHLQDLQDDRHYLEAEEIQQIWSLINHYLNALPEEAQMKLLPAILHAAGDDRNEIIQTFPASLRQKIETHSADIRQKNDTFMFDCNAKYASLLSQINEIHDPKNQAALVKAISQDLAKLRNDVLHHCTEATLYCPDLSLASFKRLQSLLLEGHVASTVERFNALEVQDVEENIDLDDATWNYFLIHFGQDSYTQLQGIFGADSLDALDAALDAQNIGTIGDFITKVLNGDQSVLKHKEALFERLNDYLETKKDVRSWIYTHLAGSALTSGTRVASVAGKVAYRATMILSTVAPIIAYPQIFAVGATSSFLCHVIPPVRRGISNFLQNTELGRYIHEKVEFIYSLATRRPFLSLFAGPPPQEIRSYDSSDTYGKLRILSWELTSGWFLLIAKLTYDINERGAGGFIQGVAIGREAAELTTRAWNCIVTVPSREV